MTWLLFLALPLFPLQNLTELLPKPLPGVNYQNLVVALLALGWPIACINSGRQVLGRSPLNLPVGLFLAFTYFAVWRSAMFLGREPPLSLSDDHLQRWRDILTSLLAFYAMSNVVRGERDVKRVLFLLMLPMPYIVWEQLAQLAGAKAAAAAALEEAGAVKSYTDDMRVSGTMILLGANELGAFLAHGLVLMAGMIVAVRSFAWRAWLLLLSVPAAVGVLFSFSRGAWVASVAGIVFLSAAWRVRAAVVLVCLMGVSPALLPDSVKSRASGTVGEEGELEASSASRLEFWTEAIHLFVQNPIAGIGLHAFIHNRWGMDTHNLHLRQLCELGIFGFTLWVTLLVVSLREAFRLYRRGSTPFLRALGLGAAAMVVAVILSNAFGDRLTHVPLGAYFWAVMGLVAAAHRMGPATEVVPAAIIAETRPGLPLAQPVGEVGWAAVTAARPLWSRVVAPLWGRSSRSV